ncbi:GGDEF domain-containing protein [Litorivita pollutaquae]|nr:GGDEF domain-containing protein [Litorivita pollutaquae]
MTVIEEQEFLEGASAAMDIFCPMHIFVSASGHIDHVGPTMLKLRPKEAFLGKRFFEVFDLCRPSTAATMEGLKALHGRKLHLQLRDAPRTDLKGVLVPRMRGDGIAINLSFGISIVDALAEYPLTSRDFAITDPTIEMLYLIEAKSAAMEASRSLNQRLQGAMIAAEEQAYTDTLTGLKNRRAMDHILGRLIEGEKSFALMHLDLDFFKAVNDTMGHAAGDTVLQKVARILVEETRDVDTVARVGGDEFVLIFNRLTERDELEEIARRMISRLEEPVPHDGQICRISGSIGTVISTDYEALDAVRLLSDADIALYASKHKGRACHTFYSDDLLEDGRNLAPPVGREAS